MGIPPRTYVTDRHRTRGTMAPLDQQPQFGSAPTRHTRMGLACTSENCSSLGLQNLCHKNWEVVLYLEVIFFSEITCKVHHKDVGPIQSCALESFPTCRKAGCFASALGQQPGDALPLGKTMVLVLFICRLFQLDISQETTSQARWKDPCFLGTTIRLLVKSHVVVQNVLATPHFAFSNISNGSRPINCLLRSPVTLISWMALVFFNSESRFFLGPSPIRLFALLQCGLGWSVIPGPGVKSPLQRSPNMGVSENVVYP